MNRHERRKKAAQARAAKAGKLPEGYGRAIEDAARLIAQWVHAEPVPPTLRWIPQKEDGVFISAALDAGVHYLADSPDAFRLIAWLDEKTGHQLSLNQALWALRLCRALPMPDGSYHGVTTVQQSPAFKTLLALGDEQKTERLTGQPCGHCGTVLDAASSEAGGVPTAGCVSVCFNCFGFNRFDDALTMVPMTEADLAGLPADLRVQLEDMASTLRHYRMQSALTGKMGTKERVDA